MERADEQILPALYGFVAASFHIGPTQLGYLTLSRALVQAVASPLGGVLGMLSNDCSALSPDMQALAMGSIGFG